MIPVQAVILCEGFDDRAFLAQWLERLGCKDARARHNGIASDPWGIRVAGGQYAYDTEAGDFVRLHPCHGRQRLARAAEIQYLGHHASRPLSHLIVVYDSDSRAPQWDRTDGSIDGVLARARASGIVASSIVWGCEDEPGRPGIPAQQTLERLVCASIVAAHPERAATVADWLAASPATEGSETKAHGYSFLAKWYADHGCEDFYRQVWRDPKVASALEQRLRAAGSWASLEAMVTAG